MSRRHGRAHGQLLGLIVGALSVLLPLHPGHAAGDNKSCWTPAMLRAGSGEAIIRKNIREAVVRPPAKPSRTLPALPAHLRGVIRRVDLPPGDKRIALTFDLCEQPDEIAGYQGDIVDFLRDKRIPATFFAGGKWLLTHSGRATQLMADRQFEIANHSWEHHNHRLIRGRALAMAIDAAQAAYELTRARLAATSCLPARPDPAARQRSEPEVPLVQRFFRFPFGACDQTSLDAVNDRGLLAIQWDVSSADPWRGMTTEAMVKHVVSRTRPGSILLFHANGRGWNTANALPLIIEQLRAKGYRFDTVAGLLSTPGARPVITTTCFDARPGDSDRYDGLGRKLIDRYNRFYKSVGIAARDATGD